MRIRAIDASAVRELERAAETRALEYAPPVEAGAYRNSAAAWPWHEELKLVASVLRQRRPKPFLGELLGYLALKSLDECPGGDVGSGRYHARRLLEAIRSLRADVATPVSGSCWLELRKYYGAVDKTMAFWKLARRFQSFAEEFGEILVEEPNSAPAARKRCNRNQSRKAIETRIP